MSVQCSCIVCQYSVVVWYVGMVYQRCRTVCKYDVLGSLCVSVQHTRGSVQLYGM
jgi:hypothetical protein